MFVVYLTELDQVNTQPRNLNLQLEILWKKIQRNRLKFICDSASESLHVATILKWILFSSKYIYIQIQYIT
jgi:hypothetical protein